MLMKSNYTKPINLGNPNEKSIMYMAKYIKSLIGSSSKIVHFPALVDDPKRRKPSIEKAKKYIEWSPKVSLKEGIQKAALYFNNELSTTND
ncbi:hypothetical protein HZS_6934 [Henneguya salminicola]|nr:hypothetical protein HZS_6934 [Henneguya salminicola]